MAAVAMTLHILEAGLQVAVAGLPLAVAWLPLPMVIQALPVLVLARVTPQTLIKRKIIATTMTMSWRARTKTMMSKQRQRGLMPPLEVRNLHWVCFLCDVV